jgi:hypothetical protein
VMPSPSPSPRALEQFRTELLYRFDVAGDPVDAFSLQCFTLSILNIYIYRFQAYLHAGQCLDPCQQIFNTSGNGLEALITHQYFLGKE